MVILKAVICEVILHKCYFKERNVNMWPWKVKLKRSKISDLKNNFKKKVHCSGGMNWKAQKDWYASVKMNRK